MCFVSYCVVAVVILVFYICMCIKVQNDASKDSSLSLILLVSLSHVLDILVLYIRKRIYVASS